MALEFITTNYVMIRVFFFFLYFLRFHVEHQKGGLCKASKLAVLVIVQNVFISLPEQILDVIKPRSELLFLYVLPFEVGPNRQPFWIIFQKLVISLPEQILDGFKVHKDKLSHNPNCFYYASCAMNLT